MKIGDAFYYVSTCCVMRSKNVYVTKTRTDCLMFVYNLIDLDI